MMREKIGVQLHTRVQSGHVRLQRDRALDHSLHVALRIALNDSWSDLDLVADLDTCAKVLVHDEQERARNHTTTTTTTNTNTHTHARTHAHTHTHTHTHTIRAPVP